jgi:hypothetical protein
MKSKKIFLLSLVLIVFALSFLGLQLKGVDNCGCAETYMGAHYVGSICIWYETPDGGRDLIYRHCYYEY